MAEVHVRRILGLARRPGSSGRSVALPGARLAVVSFDQLRVGPAAVRPPRFAFPLEVPGRVELPGGIALVAEPAEAAAAGTVVGAPRGPLEVRTRRPGDRVRVRGREQSLKRYLMQQRVPAERRASLPLVAVGHDVLWMPERALSSAGERYMRLHLEPA
jgi:tRNA(Ile)-lysidine synthase